MYNNKKANSGNVTMINVIANIAHCYLNYFAVKNNAFIPFI